jgi:hypothetical protein
MLVAFPLSSTNPIGVNCLSVTKARSGHQHVIQKRINVLWIWKKNNVQSSPAVASVLPLGDTEMRVTAFVWG